MAYESCQECTLVQKGGKTTVKCCKLHSQHFGKSELVWPHLISHDPRPKVVKK